MMMISIIIIIIIIIIHVFVFVKLVVDTVPMSSRGGQGVHESGKSSETHAEGARPPGRRTYILGDLWTSQPEQVLTCSLMKYHREVSSEARISLRRSRYSSPHLAPRTASRLRSSSPWSATGSSFLVLLLFGWYASGKSDPLELCNL